MDDLVHAIMTYEAGEMTPREQVKLFAHLVKTGRAWSLQGHYGRQAYYLMEVGLIDTDGQVDWVLFDDTNDEYYGEV